MSSGYTDQGTDYDVFFESWRSGDPKQSATRVTVNGTDFSDRFVHVNAGSPYPTPIICRVVNVDFSNLFAAKRSVPRYPTPLPWARTADVNVSIYRQPSRPTLGVSVSLSMSVHREGQVAITKTMPVYTSKPGETVTEHIWTSDNPKLWDDAGAAPNSPYQVRFDHISGPVPTLAHGHSLGQWITLNTSPFNATVFNTMTYSHGTIEGLKIATSQLRVSVRRSEWPDSNKADAVLTTNINLTVEPSVYQDTSWNGTYAGSHNLSSNNHQPEGAVNTYTGWVRLTVASNGTFLYQRGISTNAGAVTWTDIKSGQWLRNGFSINDYEILVTDPTSGMVGSHSFADWLGASTTRTFTSSHSASDGSLPGTYSKDVPGTLTIREISTKNWSGFPDNTASNSFVLQPSVVIQQPVAPDWTGVTAWNSSYVSTATATRTPESPSTTTTSTIWMEFLRNGTAQIKNNQGTIIASSRWHPSGANPDHYEVRVVRVTGGTFASNPLSAFKTITAAVDTVSANVTYSHGSNEGTFETAVTFDVEVRRKAWTAHAVTNRGTATARVVVDAPTAPVWPASFPWQGNHVDDRNVAVDPESPSTVITSRLTLTLNADGTSDVRNFAGTVLSSGRWYPSGWSAGVFEARIIGTSGAGVVNELSSFTSFTAGSRKYEVTVSRSFNDPPNSSGIFPSITVEVRRAAYHAHSCAVNNGNWIVRVTTTAPANTLSPVGDYTGWIGTYNHDKTWTIGPPANAINTSGWGGTFTNDFTKAREVAAPELANMESYLFFTTTSSGAFRINRHRWFGHGLFPYTNIFSENTLLAEQQVINTSLGAASNYEFRIVHSSGTSSGTGYSDWTNFGDNPPAGHRIFGTNRSWTTDTGTGALNGTYSIQVRHKLYPTDISRTMSFTFNTSSTLTGFVGGGSTWNGALPMGTSYNDSGTLDARQVPAQVEFIFQPNGDIRLRRNYPTATDTSVGFWSGSNANTTNTQLRAEVLSQNGGVTIGNTASSFINITANRIFSVETTTSGNVQVRFSLRDSNNTSNTITREVAIGVSRSGTSGGGGGGGPDDPTPPEFEN